MIRSFGLPLALIAVLATVAHAQHGHAQGPTEPALRLMFEVGPQSVRVTEILDLPAGAQAAAGAPLRFDLPQGAQVDTSQLLNLSQVGGALVATAPTAAEAGQPRRLAVRYTVPLRQGELEYRRQLPIAIGQVMAFAQEAMRFDVQASAPLVVRSGVRQRNGQSLEGSFTFVEGTGLAAGTPLSIGVRLAVARNPIAPLYAAIIVLVIVGFGLLQLGLVLHGRQQWREREATAAYVRQQLADLTTAREAGEASGGFADRLQQRLEALQADLKT